MNCSSHQYQILYDISLSIGTELNLQRMLRRALTAILDKLDCAAGGIHLFQEDLEGNMYFDLVYAIPLRVEYDQAYHSALQHLPELNNTEDLIKLGRQLPLTGVSDGGSYYYLLELPHIGVLILVKKYQPLQASILALLESILMKLANACQVCFHHEALKKAHHKAVAINQDLIQKGLELGKSRNELLNTLQEMRHTITTIQVMLDTIPDALLYLNRNGEILDYKIMDEKEWSISILPETVMGNTLSNLLPHEVVRLTLNHIEETLRTGKMQIFEYELPVGRTNHKFETRLVQSNSNEVVAIIHDKTERRQQHQSSQDMIVALEQNWENVSR
jgi:hypothetical protein